MDFRELITKMGGLRSMASELGVSEQEAESGAVAPSRRMRPRRPGSTPPR